MTLSSTFPNLRVLDLGTNFAAPYAAMILGDMGADVIKVERAPKGDDTRSLPPFVDGQSTVFMSVNRGKRSIMLDFKRDEDLASLRRLIASADVVIESFPPGVAEKLGLTWDDIRDVKPDIILASVSAFGDGPLGKAMPGYDALVQAVSGMMSFTGNEGEPTARIAPSVLDLTTGVWTAMGVMAALARRAGGTSAGEHLKFALIDTAFNLMNHQLMGYLATGKEPRKLGSGAPSAAPYGVYRASDGEVLIATASDDQFQRLCAALGLADVAADSRFQTMIDRIANRVVLDRLVGGAVGTRTLSELHRILGERRISFGKVNSMAEACRLPVVLERGIFVESGDEPAQLRLPLERTPSPGFGSPPLLDQHHSEILDELVDLRP
jgi:crotonobetainyl-CoA:carnitine CoA-transferase CaiB-like acyl-CoA transferase